MVSPIISGCLSTGLVLGLCLPSFSRAADEQVRLKPGDVVPGWDELKGTDDKLHSLSQLSATPVIVVCFTSNSCPYSVDYEDRMVALQKKYADGGGSVAVVAINANAVPADTLERMKERARDKHFNFSYLRDDDQRVAKSWGAVFTPEFFVLNKERRIVYMGALDDSTKPENVKVRYVELAVDAALTGGMPDVTTTAARGCQVRYPRERRRPVPETGPEFRKKNASQTRS